jgi:hypothetical protein
MAITPQTVDIMGERQSGQDVRTQNGNILILTLVVADSSWLPGVLYDLVAQVAIRGPVGLICVHASLVASDVVPGDRQRRQVVVRACWARQGMRIPL